MFNFEEFQQSKHAMDSFREWAGAITHSYLNSGIAPTVSLVKIAKAEDLVPHQIELLAAEANKMIHQHKYANEKEKYHAANFPLADAKDAIGQLQINDTVKTAAFVAPTDLGDEGPSVYEMFGVEPEVMDKTASVKHDLKTTEIKTAYLLEKMADEKIMLASKLESANHKFIKEARQMVIHEDSPVARMKTLGYIDHFVKCAGSKHGRKLLAKLAYVLEKEGKLEPRQAAVARDYFLKEADCKAPQELISENMNVSVVNGSHPLYITIKTVDDLEAESLRFNDTDRLIQTKAKILSQKIRAL